MKPIIIFSVWQAHLEHNVNMHNHLLVSELLTKTFGTSGYKELLGVYNGDEEKSFLVLDSEENRSFVISIAKEYSQESVLFLDENVNEKREAHLMYMSDSRIEYLGSLVASNVKPKASSYSYDVNSGYYFSII